MHVAITGASTGIGEALAREFAAAGAGVSLVARRADLLEKLAAEIKRDRGTATFVAPRDLGNVREATGWIPAAEAALGPIDVLVNNAGMQVVGPTAGEDVERGEDVLRLNLHTPLRLTHAVLPGMLARRRGTIVDVSSMAALAPTVGMTYYNASKGGLAAASEALRGELQGTGVHVVTVYPGIIETAMGKAGLEAYEKSAAVDYQPRGTTAGLARRVRVAVERRSPRVIYPTVYTLARWLPALTRWLMDRFSPPLRARRGNGG